MKSEQQIRDKIAELEKTLEHRRIDTTFLNFTHYEQTIHDLKWVLDECGCDECDRE